MQLAPRSQTTKYIFVTGGVVSSLGKGIAAASLGRLLVERGLRVSMLKFDPYLNVDPGTMSPFQHGEVFVTDDGAFFHVGEQRDLAALLVGQRVLAAAQQHVGLDTDAAQFLDAVLRGLGLDLAGSAHDGHQREMQEYAVVAAELDAELADGFEERQ